MVTDDEKNVFHGCISEEHLSGRVLEEGTQALCGYCGEVCKGLTLDELADRIHSALQQDSYLTKSLWIQGLNALTYLIVGLSVSIVMVDDRQSTEEV